MLVMAERAEEMLNVGKGTPFTDVILVAIFLVLPTLSFALHAF